MKYKVLKKVVEWNAELILSYEEVVLIRNSINQINNFQRGMSLELHDIRDELDKLLDTYIKDVI